MNNSNLTQQPNQNNDFDFLKGDVVVLTTLCKNYHSNELFVIEGRKLTLWVARSTNDLVLVSSREIRTATPSELQAKRRLSEAELALAEVS